MIRPAGDVRIHLYRQPVDMRKAINGLVSIVEGEMGSAPFSADLFIFCNRARTLVKMVAWEGNGFCLWIKRLEKSRFKWLQSHLSYVRRWECHRLFLLAVLGHATSTGGRSCYAVVSE